MDKQLENALLQNLILKTKIVIGFFIFYIVQSSFSIYQIISRNLDSASQTLLILFPLVPFTFMCLEFLMLRYLKGIRSDKFTYNPKILASGVLIEVTYPTFAILLTSNLFLFEGSSFSGIDMLNISQFMIYALFVVLSSLHFNFKLSLAAGIFAFLQFMGIIFYLVDLEETFQESYPVILRTIYLIPLGIIAGLVSVKIKKATLESLASKNILINELDEKVAERTKELQEQKELVEEKNIEIMDSIHYASRIQKAILPQKELIDQHLDCFIYYKPKDVVAGDFYWFYSKGDEVYLAVADCTGHGVPGAMVSVVCSGALDKSVKELNLTEPSEILEKTRDLVTQTLQEGGFEVNDGMDISFCRINSKKRIVSYAGAHNSLYRITPKNNKEVNAKVLVSEQLQCEDYKGDNMSVGKSPIMKAFAQYEIQFDEGDMLYMASDGFADQFGGEKNKKFMYKAMKKLFMDVSDKATSEQQEIIERAFFEWKGGLEQVDDICIAGIRF